MALAGMSRLVLLLLVVVFGVVVLSMFEILSFDSLSEYSWEPSTTGGMVGDKSLVEVDKTVNEDGITSKKKLKGGSKVLGPAPLESELEKPKNDDLNEVQTTAPPTPLASRNNSNVNVTGKINQTESGNSTDAEDDEYEFALVPIKSEYGHETWNLGRKNWNRVNNWNYDRKTVVGPSVDGHKFPLVRDKNAREGVCLNKLLAARPKFDKIVDQAYKRSCTHIGNTIFRYYLENHGQSQFLEKKYLRAHFDEGLELFRKSRGSFVQYYKNEPLISIRGLMSSGTNWLRFILRKNCKKHTLKVPQAEKDKYRVPERLTEGIYGWKHGWLTDFEIQRLIHNKNHKMLLLTRDAMTWLAAMPQMMSMPWEVGPTLYTLRTGTLDRQLVEPWARMCNFEFDWYYPWCLFEYENKMFAASSILEWRARLYGQFYNLSLAYPDTFFVIRYEDLRDKTNEIWDTVLYPNSEEVGMGCNQVVSSTNKRVKFGTEHQEKFDNTKYENQACKTFAGRGGFQGFEIMTNTLDAELERNLGYVYTSNTQHCIYFWSIPRRINSMKQPLMIPKPMRQYIDDAHNDKSKKTSKQLLMVEARDAFLKSIENRPLITIRGMMFSPGPDALREIINKLCKNSALQVEFATSDPSESMMVDLSDEVYGWKFSPPGKPEVARIGQTNNHAMVLITSDAMTWTSLAHEKISPHLLNKETSTFDHFVESQVQVTCEENGDWYDPECMFTSTNNTVEFFQNLLDWRTQLVQRFASLAKSKPDKFFRLRIEDLRANFSHHWTNDLLPRFEKLGLQCEIDQAAVEVWEKEQHQKAADEDSISCQQFGGAHGTAAFTSLLSHLDIGAEKDIGFEYSTQFQHCPDQKDPQQPK